MKQDSLDSVWERYVEAKRRALAGEGAETTTEGEVLTLEQLEKAIADTAAASGLPEMGMPPRAVVHPAVRKGYSRWFYMMLVVLFIGLIATLFWWGKKKYEG